MIVHVNILFSCFGLMSITFRVMSLLNKLSRIFYINCVLAICIIVLSVCIGLYKRPNNWKSKPDNETTFFKIENMAEPDEFPYHVSIQLKKKHICSGALIGPKHILTAGHCANMLKPKTKDVAVVIGTFILPGGTTHEAQAIEIHPNFNHATSSSNVAVIRLKQVVTQTDYIKIIQLPDRKKIMDYNQIIDISDFNAFLRGQTHTYLQKFIRHVSTTNFCIKNGRKYYETWDLSGKFCAVANSTEYGNGIQDDGSPATVDKKYITGIYAGISEWGSHPTIPDFFIDVSSYLDFIKKELDKN